MSRVHDTAWHSWLQPQGSQVVAHWLSGMFCSPSLSSLARAPGQQLISLRNFGGRQAQGDQPDAALARQHVPPPGLQNDFTDDGTAQGTQAQPPEIPSSSQALAGNRGSPQPAPEAVPAVRRLHQLSEEPQELQEDLRCRLQRMHEHLRRKEHRQALQAFNTSLPPRVSHTPPLHHRQAECLPFPANVTLPSQDSHGLGMHLAICTGCRGPCRGRRERSPSCLTPPSWPLPAWGTPPWPRTCCAPCWPAASASVTWLTAASCGLCATSAGPRWVFPGCCRPLQYTRHRRIVCFHNTMS